MALLYLLALRLRGQRAADHHEPGDDDADEDDDEHHGERDEREADQVTTRHASEGTSPDPEPFDRVVARNVGALVAVRIGTRML